MKNNLIETTNTCLLFQIEDIIKSKIKNRELLECVLDLIKNIKINRYEILENAITLLDTTQNEELTFSFDETTAKVNYKFNEQKYLNIEIEENKKEKRINVKIDTGDSKTKTYNQIEEKYLRNKLFERKSVLINNNESDELCYKKTTKLVINHAKQVTKKEITECAGQEPITKTYTQELKKPILYSRKRRQVINATSLENSMIWSTQYKQDKTVKKELKK